MGITDISSTAVSGNTITIDSVTDDLFITVTTNAASSSGVITPIWETGNFNGSTGAEKDDSTSMRTNHIAFDTSAYTYYVTPSSDCEGLSKMRFYRYNADGTYNLRTSFSTVGVTAGVATEIPFTTTTGTFRIKADFGSTNTLENMNDRLVITRVAK